MIIILLIKTELSICERHYLEVYTLNCKNLLFVHIYIMFNVGFKM